MQKILQQILAVLDKKEKRRFALLSLLDIVISILDIISLALLLWIIRFYLQPVTEKNVLPGGLAGFSPFMLIGFLLILFAIKNLAGFLISRAQFNFIGSIAVRISKNSLASYQNSRFQEFTHIDSSAHIRNIAFQPFEFSQYILSGVQQIITQFSLILVTIIAILVFNAKLFLLLLLVLLPPVIIVSYFIKRRLAVAKRNIQEGNQRSFQYLLDALKGYVESNIYNRNEFFMKRFIAARQKFSNNLFDSLAWQTMPSRVIEIFAVSGLFILVAIAKWTGNSNGATLITIGAFMAAAYKIIPGIVKVINISGQMKGYEFNFSNDLKKDNIKNAIETVGHKDIQSIEFKAVDFKYENQQVLDAVSFHIEKGDFISITGDSGKGKTTILHLLLGFLSPVGGDIMINNEKVDAEMIKDYWKSISYVRQQKFLINDSLLRNMTLEEEGFHKNNLRNAIDVSGLEKLLVNYPEGLDKIITENGKNISGGQQQRIAIARAIYKNSDVILLDEPFNELDEESTVTLLEHFSALTASGKIVVLITHDKKSQAYCNKTFQL